MTTIVLHQSQAESRHPWSPSAPGTLALLPERAVVPHLPDVVGSEEDLADVVAQVGSHPPDASRRGYTAHSLAFRGSFALFRAVARYFQRAARSYQEPIYLQGKTGSYQKFARDFIGLIELKPRLGRGAL